MKKGQVEPLTAVLITALIIGSVGTVYVWGTPLLEKREAETAMVGVENNLIELQNTMINVENSGQGSTERVTMDLPEDAELNIDTTTNSITVQDTTSEPIYAEDTQFTLAGSNVTRTAEYDGGDILYGIEGVNDPSVLEVSTRSAGDGATQITYELRLNNLLTTTHFGEVITVRDLQLRSEDTETQRSFGEVDVVVTNDGEQIEEDSAETDQIVDVQKQVIEVSLD